MKEILEVKDLSPFQGLCEEDGRWLGELHRHLRTSDHVIRLGDAKRDEDHVVYRSPDGEWQAGRYIGELALNGRRLRISPRLGEETIAGWLAGALNLVAIPETAVRRTSEDFLAGLMGAVWSRAVDAASRHGPPAIRHENQHEGQYVRGRVDLRGTARLRGSGSSHVASTTRPRDLDNDVSRVLVAAERVLTQHIGHTLWRTPRVRQILPHLVDAVGARPRPPRERDLARIRYTPITRPFKEVARLSSQIARQQGFVASGEKGKVEGLLLDVAELWELFLLSCTRRAASGFRVEHATTSGADQFLLHAAKDNEKSMGRIKPDILVSDAGKVTAVIDAKYKRLADRWPDRLDGVDRGDLYQLSAYLARHDPGGNGLGALLYPNDPFQVNIANAEAQGVWHTESGSSVVFRRISAGPDEAVLEIRDLLGGAGRSQPTNPEGTNTER